RIFITLPVLLGFRRLGFARQSLRTSAWKVLPGLAPVPAGSRVRTFSQSPSSVRRVDIPRETCHQFAPAAAGAANPPSCGQTLFVCSPANAAPSNRRPLPARPTCRDPLPWVHGEGSSATDDSAKSPDRRQDRHTRPLRNLGPPGAHLL